MIPIEESHAWLQNVALTYTKLAQGMPGAFVEREVNVWRAAGDFPHAGCNFAVGIDWSLEEAEACSINAAPHPCFQLYELACTRGSEAALQASGWVRSYSLASLLAEPTTSRYACLRLAETVQERRAVAEFMAVQFLSGQPERTRQVIASATAADEGFRLFTLGSDGLTEGAVMLHEAGACIGLYNLCVAERCRGQGVGRRIVDAVLELAKLPVSLQCEPRLAGWYSESGFQDVGSVDAFVWAPSNV